MNKFTTTRFTLWALLLTMPLLFSSCKKDKDDVTPVTTNAIEGNWKLTGMKVNPAIDTGLFGKTDDFYQLLVVAFDAGDCLNSLVITFNRNGTTSVNNPPACQGSTDELSDLAPISGSSKWVLTGNKLTTTDADGTIVTHDVTISGNTMTWTTLDEMKDGNGNKVKTTVTTTLTRA